MSEENQKPENEISPEVINKLPPVRKGHVCGVCHKWFKKSSDLRRHIVVHTKEKTISCDHCHLKFANKDRLRLHQRYLLLEKSFQCDFCEKSFKLMQSLKSHLRVHTNEKPFKCEMCDLNFFRKNALQYHYSQKKYLSHHRQFEDFKQFEYLIERFKPLPRDYFCTVCSKRFRTQDGLKMHGLNHINQVPFECDICGMKIKRKENLRKHKKAVHAANPANRQRYHCDLCEKSFFHKKSLAVHKAVHLKVKPFTCDVCSYAFATKSLLMNHMFTHTGEKKYSCEICNKGYQSIGSLKYHMREHTGEKPYVCDICGMSFKCSSGLKRHFDSKAHKQEVKNATFKSSENVVGQIGKVLPKNEGANSKKELTPNNRNIDNNIKLTKPDESLFQTVSKNLSAAKEAFSKGNNVFTFENIKFVKVQNTADPNCLRLTHLFNRYRT